MDNRRVYKKQAPKKNDKNLLFKVKRFFVSSLWNNQDNYKSRDINHGSDSASDSLPSKSNDVEVGDIAGPGGPSTPKSNSTNMEASTDTGSDKTPNVLLSEFFHKKGNQPLTAVEYEGVMSLISQSNKKPNDGIRSPIMPGAFSRYDTPIPGSTSKKHSQNHDQHHNHSMIEPTPSKQKSLRNTSTSKESSPKAFATPEYRPVYHNITSSTKKSGVSSVKRVYQFSGLPSPYRTRIKAPIMSPNKRIKSGGDSSLVLSLEKSKPSKPMNKAASTLLSVLDDSKKNNSNYILQFSNPYMGSSSVSKRHGNLTADAINSTIMFDQSTDLPDSMSNNSSVTTPAADSVTNNESNTNVASGESNNETTASKGIPFQSSNKINLFGSSSSATSKPQPETNANANENANIHKVSNSENNGDGTSGLKNVVVSSSDSTSSAATESSAPKAVDSKFPASGSALFTSNQNNLAGFTKSTTKENPAPTQESAPMPTSVFANTKNNEKDSLSSSNINNGLFGFSNGNSKPNTGSSLLGQNNTTNTFPNVNNGAVDTINGTDAKSSDSQSFKFPQIEVKHVALDQSKVDNLKQLFTFHV